MMEHRDEQDAPDTGIRGGPDDAAGGSAGASENRDAGSRREIRDLRDVPPARVHEEYDPAKHGERRTTPRGRR
jgi:hypothetical protein